MQGARRLPQQACAVGLPAHDLQKLLGFDQLFDLGFALRPAVHEAASPPGVISPLGEALVSRTGESTSLTHLSRGPDDGVDLLAEAFLSPVGCAIDVHPVEISDDARGGGVRRRTECAPGCGSTQEP